MRRLDGASIHTPKTNSIGTQYAQPFASRGRKQRADTAGFFSFSFPLIRIEANGVKSEEVNGRALWDLRLTIDARQSFTYKRVAICANVRSRSRCWPSGDALRKQISALNYKFCAHSKSTHKHTQATTQGTSSGPNKS